MKEQPTLLPTLKRPGRWALPHLFPRLSFSPVPKAGVSIVKSLRDWLRARLDRRLPQHLPRRPEGRRLGLRLPAPQGLHHRCAQLPPRNGKQELDLVAWDKEQLAVIEVKTRASVEFGEPARAVDARKRRHLIHAAGEYARRAGVDAARTGRFDIVSVVLGDDARVQLEKDAFSRRSVARQRRK